MAIIEPIIGRSIKRKMGGMRGKKMPFIAGHKLLYTCNLRCDMCPFWRRKDERLLSIDEEIMMMDSLASAGVSFMGFEGGEPLLRNDLEDILRESHRRFHTSLVTNGWLLKNRASSIAKYLDYLFVSIDGLKETHDKQRGVPGSFEHALEGIEEAKKYVQVAISTTITTYNMNEITKVVELAKDLGVGINVQVSYDYSTANNLSPEKKALYDVLLSLKKMKEDGYPIVNSKEYFDTLISSWYYGIKWACKPWSTVNIDPQGRIVMPCYVLNEYAGSSKVWETDIVRLWNTYDWSQYESCNKCSLSCYLEPSIFSWKKLSMVNERIIGSIANYISSML
ncbi:molybdopterin cofactor biosynthetic protein [Thermoplasma volcanium GSS1]|uniref:Molybdopterin cofactor biosynthetic protein n=1 Tax=Thermoplasma volcanium (strain ATCC 51530 / DSM 4299 / JCM 9571 / NBRC 15438 / GSS1) TaxID=273116 RepID=Q97C03_THEVO|nr:PTO1314 family radical SAM protein [Thermoplasma volcanium]BAB59444.1 molybdopterin cofactor biosynthetic protein [Thermoplasma volcanium GSS1]